MKLFIGVALTFCVLTMAACKDSALNRQDCVGSYVFVVKYDKRSDLLRLNADGTYETTLVRPNIPKRGHWKFDLVGSDALILLERSGFPVKRQGKTIQISINDDLGEWFEKQE